MGAFGLWVAFEIIPELLHDSRTFREHEEGKDEDENEGGEETSDGADASSEVCAEVSGDASRNVLNIVYDFALEVFDADGFTKIVEPREAIGNGFDGFRKIFGEIDSFVHDGWDNDREECGQTTNNDEVSNCDWKFKWVNGEGNEKRSADDKEASGGFE